MNLKNWAPNRESQFFLAFSDIYLLLFRNFGAKMFCIWKYEQRHISKNSSCRGQHFQNSFFGQECLKPSERFRIWEIQPNVSPWEYCSHMSKWYLYRVAFKWHQSWVSEHSEVICPFIWNSVVYWKILCKWSRLTFLTGMPQWRKELS